MSIYATRYIVNEEGEPLLLKRLNKLRVDRKTLRITRNRWNKSGLAQRAKKATAKWKAGIEAEMAHKTRISE